MSGYKFEFVFLVSAIKNKRFQMPENVQAELRKYPAKVRQELMRMIISDFQTGRLLAQSKKLDCRKMTYKIYA